MSSVRVAVYDLGSGSFHLTLIEAARDGTLSTLLRRRSTLNLGREVAGGGAIGRERAAAALRAVRRLHEVERSVGADLVIANATAALRDAANGAALRARMEAVLGTSIRQLSGVEEARLCFVGQRAGVWTSVDDPVLGIDLGGGSLEAAIGTATSVLATASVPIGTARLAAELGIEVEAPLGAAMEAALIDRTTELLGPVLDVARAARADRRLIASGGAIRALARIAIKLHRRHVSHEVPVSVNQVAVPAGQLRELADHLADLPLAARLELPGVQRRRAPFLPVGAAIVCAIVEALGADGVVVSEWGLREGAVLDALGIPAR